ncbi:MAG: hypothetical protein IKT46_03210 [Clostridia bacterium]|nr:hypothetical protein [Clostridia bacterium]
MDFKKRMKIRLWTNIIYIVLGVAMIAAGFITKTDNEFVSSFGLTLTVVGLALIKKNIITSEEKLKRREIAENDERNIAIVHKARSWAFSFYVILGCLAVIVLSLLSLQDIASWIGVGVFSLIAIYWICYFIVRKKY